MTDKKTIFITIDMKSFSVNELSTLTAELNKTFSNNYKVVVLNKNIELNTIDEVKQLFNKILDRIDDGKSKSSNTSEQDTKC